jgi:hypothetical protein
MRYLGAFVLSEGDKYRELEPYPEDIHPRKAPSSSEEGLDGWSYMMRTPGKDFALLYFENRSVLPYLSGFMRNKSYEFRWFDPRNGEWENVVEIESDKDGELKIPDFPDGKDPSITDWAAKISGGT